MLACCSLLQLLPRTNLQHKLEGTLSGLETKDNISVNFFVARFIFSFFFYICLYVPNSLYCLSVRFFPLCIFFFLVCPNVLNSSQHCIVSFCPFLISLHLFQLFISVCMFLIHDIVFMSISSSLRLSYDLLLLLYMSLSSKFNPFYCTMIFLFFYCCIFFPFPIVFVSVHLLIAFHLHFLSVCFFYFPPF